MSTVGFLTPDKKSKPVEIIQPETPPSLYNYVIDPYGDDEFECGNDFEEIPVFIKFN
jgi:hypothetical protein